MLVLNFRSIQTIVQCTMISEGILEFQEAYEHKNKMSNQTEIQAANILLLLYELNDIS